MLPQACIGIYDVFMCSQVLTYGTRGLSIALQPIPQVRHRKRKPATRWRLYHPGVNQPAPVLLSIVSAHAHTIRNVRHPARAIVSRHGSQELDVLLGQRSESCLVEGVNVPFAERAQASRAFATIQISACFLFFLFFPFFPISQVPARLSMVDIVDCQFGRPRCLWSTMFAVGMAAPPGVAAKRSRTKAAREPWSCSRAALGGRWARA